MIPLLQFLTLMTHPCVHGMIEAHDFTHLGLCMEVAHQEQAIGVPVQLSGRMGRVSAWMVDELKNSGELDINEIAAVITIGRGESAFDPGGRSHRSLPDEMQGGAHGVLQMTARTAKFLKVDLKQLRSKRRSSLADQAKASRYAARAALTFYRTRTSLARRYGLKTHLEGLRRITRTPYQLRQELWTSWAAGTGVRSRNAGKGLRRSLKKRNIQFPRYDLAIQRWMAEAPQQNGPVTTAALSPRPTHIARQ